MDDATLTEIVRSGILAPAADNHHPFVFKYAGALLLLPAKSTDDRTSQHRRLLDLISIGAVVENMHLRATELGLFAKVSWPPADRHDFVARLELERDCTVEVDPLATAIPLRHTNRRPYKGPRLAAAEREVLAGEVARCAGVNLTWLEGPSRRNALRMVWLAESERFRREPLHDELFSAIRFDLSWQEPASEGLPPGALEVETPMRPLFKALRDWRLMRVLNRLGVFWLLGLRAGLLPCLQAPELGVLSTVLPMEDGARAVGRALQRVWLRSTLLNLALQPMAASVVLPYFEGVSSGLRETLVSGWRKTLGRDEVPLMLFRLGRSAPPRVRAGRLEATHYLAFD